MLAVDMSKWGGPLTSEEADCLKERGWTRVVVGISELTVARQQLLMARSRGLNTQGYAYLYWDSPTYYVERAITYAGDMFDFLWIDVEQNAGGRSYQQIIDSIKAAVAVCEARGMPCGIYTSRSKWHELTGNTQAFRHLPLWNAYYDGDQDVDFGRAPYGGWAAPAMEQYGNTQYVCGQSVDVNFYYEEQRVKYTDETLDGVFAEILGATGKSLDISRTLATAFFDHLQNTPLPAGSQTDVIAQLSAEVDEIQEVLDKFSKALSDAA